jgi:3-hydroxybutyryl-CoA dehydrogenase
MTFLAVGGRLTERPCMNMKPIRQIAVVGAGLMGHGIALDFAVAGFQVALQDVDEVRLRQAMGRIQATLPMLAAAGRFPPEEVGAIAARVHPHAALPAATAHADLVVESVFEDLSLKQAIFQELDRACPPHTILASNTSSLPPTRLAAATARPEKVMVAHYFNPPYLLPLVEVVMGEATSEETASAVCGLLAQAGKKPVLLKREAPGFVVNRLQAALVREAIAIVDRGIAAPEDVDAALRYGLVRRLAVTGALEPLDLAGLDLALTVAKALLPDLESSPQVPAGLRERVERGQLGVKSGQGFYSWTPESAAARSRAIAQALLEIAQIADSPGACSASAANYPSP